MNNYLSRAELDKISEGLLEMYAKQNGGKATPYIDIEHFITDFLKLKITYAPFAEDDPGRIGFLSDGETPLMVFKNGRAVPWVFPKETIVLDNLLLSDKEIGRRRFTMAHEASHYILERMNRKTNTARYHTEFDSERLYTKQELTQMFATTEWQSDALGASLLMPRYLVEKNANTVGIKLPVKVYGETVFSPEDKTLIREVARRMVVSYTALMIRLRELNLIEHHEISEFIASELQLGGV